MSDSKSGTSFDALRRKLRGITGIFRDPAATEHEKANAEALKTRLEAQLKQAGEPSGDWSDVMFRLGRTAKAIKQSTAPTSQGDAWTDHAFRLGRAVQKGLKKWRGP